MSRCGGRNTPPPHALANLLVLALLAALLLERLSCVALAPLDLLVGQLSDMLKIVKTNH
jgi:hypothetical protein